MCAVINKQVHYFHTI